MPKYYTVNETAQALGLSKNGLYKLIYAGKIPAVKVGRAIRIPADALKPENLPPVLGGEA